MKTLGIVTCESVLPHARSEERPLFTKDDLHMIRVWEARGHKVLPLVWTKPLPTDVTLDAVVVRSPWDYQEDMEGFLAWLQSVEDAGIPLANDLETIRWNIDKRYLLELAEQGLPSIPTVLLNPEETHVSLKSIMDKEGWDEAIVKPAVGAGAKNNFRLTLDTVERFETESFAALRQEGAYLLQPFVKEVVTAGEWSLTFFGGVYSHSALKKAKAGDYRVQDDHGGSTHAESAPASLVAQAKEVLKLIDRPLLYARVDGIEVDGDFRLIEVELIEPELFLRAGERAGELFADAIEQWLDLKKGQTS
jgi:glutathione synthase/RimK-type ligase-like ATP-grasp enzyme